MANKKEQKHSVPKITAKIDRMTNPDAKIKAYASANIGGAFIVKDIAVMDSKNGLFARMPCRSYKDGKGETKFSDMVFALTAEARTAMNDAVVSAYEEQLNMQEGKIALIKHCDDGSTQIETPEVGAEFEVFLKSSGSYESAKESERDILVCNEFGFAETKDLPYGIYTVRQTKGWEGKELMPAFDVFVKEDGETYRYLINNATFESLILTLSLLKQTP